MTSFFINTRLIEGLKTTLYTAHTGEASNPQRGVKIARTHFTPTPQKHLSLFEPLHAFAIALLAALQICSAAQHCALKPSALELNKSHFYNLGIALKWRSLASSKDSKRHSTSLQDLQ